MNNIEMLNNALKKAGSTKEGVGARVRVQKAEAQKQLTSVV